MASSNTKAKQSSSKRTQSVAKGAKNGVKNSNGKSSLYKEQRHSRGSLIDSGTRNDIVGVVLAALGIALFIAVLSPGDGLLTSFISDTFLLVFGVGAYAIPVGLVALGISCFLRNDDTPIARNVIGIAVLVFAALILLALIGYSQNAELASLFASASLKAHGGYVGAGPAWLLLKLSNKLIACVISIALLISGIIICGFSVSKQAKRVQQKMAAPKSKRTREDSIEISPEQREPESRKIERPASSRLGSSRVASSDFKPNVRSASGVMDDVSGFSAERSRILRSRGEALLSSFAAADNEFSADQGNASDRAEEIPSFLELGKDPYAAAAVSSSAATVLLDRGAATAKDPAPSTVNKQPCSEQPAPISDDSKTAAKTAKPANPPIADEDEGSAALFQLPPLSLISSTPGSEKRAASSKKECSETASALQKTLADFNLNARVVDWQYGPTVTLYKVEMPVGVHLSKITSLQNDIALALAARSVRIYAPIPGTSLVGVEVPNKSRCSVLLGDIMPEMEGGPMTVAIGKNIEGKMISADISKMPHLLVGGTTGSGKTVVLKAMLCSMLMRTTPEELRMIIIDPKRVDFSVFKGMPHLFVPVVTDPKEAAAVLAWATIEMERRLKLLEEAGANEILVYNDMVRAGQIEGASIMPYMLILIDELSDLMMVAGKEVEGSIVRISQLARAVGIHLVIATQRPSSNVVTGMIKTNIVTRIALKVATGIDSRIILDQPGAEKLIGMGDLLFLTGDCDKPQRIQGCYIDPKEIHGLVEFLKTQGSPEYHNEVLSTQICSSSSSSSCASSGNEPDDPLLWEAAEIVVNSGFGSTSNLQRRLKVGYARAGRIMDQLYEHGIVGPADGSKAREVLISDVLELESLKAFEAND